MTAAFAPLLMAATLALPAHAEQDADQDVDQDEAKTCIAAKLQDAYAQGWSIRTSTTATVAASDTDVYALTLQVGNTYSLLACGDANLTDVGLYIYDSEGAVVAQDDSINREPQTQFKPAATGKYYVVIQAVAMSGKATSGAITTAVTYK